MSDEYQELIRDFRADEAIRRLANLALREQAKGEWFIEMTEGGEPNWARRDRLVTALGFAVLRYIEPR